MGLMPLFVGLLATSVTGAPTGQRATDCIASDPSNAGLCVRTTPRALSPYRLSSDLAAESNGKMDAIEVDPRPCRLIGIVDCPGKRRVLFRSNESNWLALRAVNPFTGR